MYYVYIYIHIYNIYIYIYIYGCTVSSTTFAICYSFVQRQ